MNKDIIERLRPTESFWDEQWERAAYAEARSGARFVRTSQSRRRKALIAGFVTAAVVTGAGAAVATGVVPVNPLAGPTADTEPPRPVVTVESPTPSGVLTNGSLVKGEQAPDLVGGQTDEGKPGFLRSYDLVHAPAPDKNGDIVIPVYATDGRTVIGHFTAGHVKEENEEKQ
jgi:hypothetical protein